jgi:hypothetical protein
MREITHHKVEGYEDGLRVQAMDEPGRGGANHEYVIRGAVDSQYPRVWIMFQNGPIPECGVNGITQEVLLAIVIDRLEGFQSGEFACDENADALYHAKLALESLKDRTKDRITREVEGKSEP